MKSVLQVNLKGHWHYLAYIQGRTIVTTRNADKAAPGTRGVTVRQAFPHMQLRVVAVTH